jgi:hypothetical protein
MNLQGEKRHTSNPYKKIIALELNSVERLKWFCGSTAFQSNYRFREEAMSIGAPDLALSCQALSSSTASW